MAKPAKTRIKTTAQIAAQSKDDVIAFIREMGDVSREVKRLEATMNDGIAALQQQYADQSAPHNQRLDELQNAVQLWCEDLVTGIVKWRNNPPSVRITGVDAVIALLNADPELVRFIRTKEEINKDAVLNERVLFDQGQVPGLKIVEGKEFFVIEPHDQELSGV